MKQLDTSVIKDANLGKTNIRDFTSAELEKDMPLKKGKSHHVIIKTDDVSKTFDTGTRHIEILKNINFNLYSGEFTMIVGPSGCGKSTLLHTLIGLEKPSSGFVFLRDENIYKMGADKRAKYRGEKIGMVFQQSNWIKAYNVLQNVAYPLLLSGKKKKISYKKAEEALELIGLNQLHKQRPTELSGGEQQRVALARALVTDPWIIVADEPTGNLDSDSGLKIMKTFARLNRINRKMVLIVSHDTGFLPLATRVIGMEDGEIKYDNPIK